MRKSLQRPHARDFPRFAHPALGWAAIAVKSHRIKALSSAVTGCLSAGESRRSRPERGQGRSCRWRGLPGSANGPHRNPRRLASCESMDLKESVRSRGDYDEDDIDNSTFCRDSALLSPCHRPLHHRMTERSPAILKSAHWFSRSHEASSPSGRCGFRIAGLRTRTQ